MDSFPSLSNHLSSVYIVVLKVRGNGEGTDHIREAHTGEAIQTGPLSKPLKDTEQTERTRQENVTALSFHMLREHQRNSGGSFINIKFQFTLNPPSH